MSETNRIVLRDAAGRVYLRAAINVAFFLKPPIDEVVSELRAVFDEYLGMVSPETLRWEAVGAAAEEWKPFNSTTIKRCRAQLSQPAASKRRLTAFELADGEVAGDAPQNSFQVLGGPIRTNLPQETCLLQMCFPSDAVKADSVDGFVAQVRQLASLMPYVSGYCSPVLNWAELGREEAIARTRDIVARHAGFDIHMNSTGRTWLGTRVRGARWLTFLGRSLVDALGGQESLRRSLSAEIDLQTAGDGLMVRAGKQPELGDATKGQETPLLRTVARVIEPVTAFEEVVLLGSFADWDKDALRNWERRFL